MGVVTSGEGHRIPDRKAGKKGFTLEMEDFYYSLRSSYPLWGPLIRVVPTL